MNLCRQRCVVQAAFCFLLSGFCFSGSEPVRPVLHVTALQVTNLCMASWTPADDQVGGTGGGSITTNSYSGPAYFLWAEPIGPDPILIECSTDLTNWQAFPGPGCYLTLTSSNSSATVTAPAGALFFRSKQ